MTNNIRFCLYLTQFFLEWEMFHTKSCRANQNTHFMLNSFFRKLCIYEIMWKNNVGRSRPRMTCRACAMDAGYFSYTHTNTRSGYVILNAFPLQQRLHEHASMLCYTYIAWFSDFLTYSTRLCQTDYRINSDKSPLIQHWVKIRATEY
jgi:hypothetical protein